MTGDEDPLDDAWDDDPYRDDYPGKEEPDCGGCYDSGIDRRTGRHCRSCEPTRVDLIVAALRWRASALLARLRGRRPTTTDEAPF